MAELARRGEVILKFLERGLENLFKDQEPDALDKKEIGQGLVEYSLVIVLVAVSSLVVLAIFGDAIKSPYCSALDTLIVTPTEACYETIAGGVDGPEVLRARYSSNTGRLRLVAVLPEGCTTGLYVQGYGPMTQWRGSKYYHISIDDDPPPSTVTIGSDACGWTTVTIN